jgi:cytochrome c2
MPGAAILAVAGTLVACAATPSPVLPGASAQRGHDLIVRYGCGACHEIGGVVGADGQVGPPLTDYRDRRFIAGALPLTAANTARWIQHPQQIEPQTIMPDLGVTPRQAADITAYLYGQ